LEAEGNPWGWPETLPVALPDLSATAPVRSMIFLNVPECPSVCYSRWPT
jgi:hypothetical protein